VLYNLNLYLIAQVVFNIPNSTFQNTNNFKRKFLVSYLQEAKQSTFADRIDDLVVGTGLASKACTHLITAETQNITTVKGLIGLLDKERLIRQIHLSLHTLDSSKELYNTKTSSGEDQKPLAKPQKPVATRKNSCGGRNANKRVKQEKT
jgi:hypothetical protein